MKHNKKLLPAWLLVLIDSALIAVYILGFYYSYYLNPRQLESAGVKTNQERQDSLSNSSMNFNDVESAAGGNETDTANENIIDETVGANQSAASDETTPPKTTDNSTATGNLRTKFAQHFSDTVVSTDNSYTSRDISIQVNKYTEGSDGNIVTYYVADIYIADITCLASGFAKDTYGIGYAEDLLSMDESFNAILAINGDYYGNGGDGVVIRNGEVYRKTSSDSDVCVLYYDGTMKTYSADEFDVNRAITDGAYQAWCFGPELLDKAGRSITEFTASRHIKEENPRTAIGYYESGHYAFVVVDGRQSGYSYGMTLSELSDLFENLGCKTAYNLDGGKSSEMSFHDTLVNRPAEGGREVSDCIMIKEVK
ncbi:phosphodiester glycosidase family protein [Anaerocolumna sedimenticola]|uniref:Phosphodiester glycosidase family protein n=1 Tax=Anaerocolumna sedimenticola TaxID=2696063 RepID=A0A6P1TH61_9FIRM|nr:phosphodiester glycosidase family protein [Anaerocolumna sedimenticola]QHQ59432.1 phosphodiester glycosidase family protein [Anaerocolumna sedimenticola]